MIYEKPAPLPSPLIQSPALPPPPPPHTHTASASGPDYLACRAAYKKLKREEQMHAWRTSPTSERKASPPSPRSLQQQQRSKEAEAKQRSEALKQVGAYSFERWLEEKEQQHLKEVSSLHEFQHQVVEEDRVRQERLRAERERLREREKGWPSRIALEKRPGAYSDPLRLEATRRMYRDSRSRANPSSFSGTSSAAAGLGGGLASTRPTSTSPYRPAQAQRPSTVPVASTGQRGHSSSVRPGTSASAGRHAAAAAVASAGQDAVGGSSRPKTRRGESAGPDHTPISIPVTIPEHQELEAAAPVMHKLRPGTSYAKNRNSSDGVDASGSDSGEWGGGPPGGDIASHSIRTSTAAEFADMPDAPLEEYSDEEFGEPDTRFVDGGNNTAADNVPADVPIIVTQAEDEAWDLVEGSDVMPPSFARASKQQPWQPQPQTREEEEEGGDDAEAYDDCAAAADLGAAADDDGDEAAAATALPATVVDEEGGVQAGVGSDAGGGSEHGSVVDEDLPIQE